MDLKGKRVLVVGAARSGQAVARFLAAREIQVTLTDARRRSELHLGELAGVRLALGAYPEISPQSWDLVVVSPGVPFDAPLLVQAREQGIPVIGELELAWCFTRAPVIAVTGTNGKTTTTALLGEVFRQAGRRTLVAGNIGVPLISEVEAYGPEDMIVVEVSSFQLETVHDFRPLVAVILNLTPDHLDRHGTMEAYVEAKAAIVANQGPSDWTVLNHDDPVTAALASRTKGSVIFFSRQHKLEQGVFIQEGQILARGAAGETLVCGTDSLALPGTHNQENALAAVAAGWAVGVDTAALARALAGFRGVPHRLEAVGQIDGVSYVNDSKATNPEAACRALEAYAEPIVLIAGGRNKGNDFNILMERTREKARVLIVLGECADEMMRAADLAGVAHVLQAADLAEAVGLARNAALPGEVVLLSPACASWDMFESYEERGDLFRRLVQELAREAG
ncbi:MAG: UDP-N-acetylmuramoyl-L-alanine--D-glutamate ligase [Candidatus Desulforudis sp.]|nr:UDP-N-acetylmuramoyl-L-alanine--D-glutamate ligase [Desulforudis sp.]